ncbi:MAG: hypothetical protein R3B70_44490 [Polyangiaceae bacterium]
MVNERPVIEELRGCLEIVERSLLQRHAFMTPGVLELCFLKGHSLLARVALLSPDFIRWDGWAGDALLRDGERLLSWLRARGWDDGGMMR